MIGNVHNIPALTDITMLQYFAMIMQEERDMASMFSSDPSCISAFTRWLGMVTVEIMLPKIIRIILVYELLGSVESIMDRIMLESSII